MVYCVAFGCNSNSFSSENISFFRLSADAVHEVGKRKKLNVITTITITTECNTVNHYDKIYCVFKSLTYKNKQYLLTIFDKWHHLEYLICDWHQ